jgi:hypothetical protein
MIDDHRSVPVIARRSVEGVVTGSGVVPVGENQDDGLVEVAAPGVGFAVGWRWARRCLGAGGAELAERARMRGNRLGMPLPPARPALTSSRASRDSSALPSRWISELRAWAVLILYRVRSRTSFSSPGGI